MNTTRYALLPTVVCCALFLLVGCGDLGEDKGAVVALAATQIAPPTTQSAASTTPAAVEVPALVPSTYALGSEELAAFNLLNAERDRCGFGTLAQNALLDVAAIGHADYQNLNQLFTHVQDAVAYPLGFTGAQPADRVAAAGYTDAGGVTDEMVRFTGSTLKSGLGTRGVRNLLSAPYHLRGLMDGYRDVGIAMRSSQDVGTTTKLTYLQMNAAYKASAGPQLLAANAVNTYPCDGTTGVNRQLRNETPNPVPGRDLAVNPLGSIILVAVREGNTLLIDTAVMTEVQTGRNVTLRPPITAANDPYRNCQEGCYQPHQAYLAADVPLLASAAYGVAVTGSNNGVPFSRVFTFRTGTGG